MNVIIFFFLCARPIQALDKTSLRNAFEAIYLNRKNIPTCNLELYKLSVKRWPATDFTISSQTQPMWKDVNCPDTVKHTKAALFSQKINVQQCVATVYNNCYVEAASALTYFDCLWPICADQLQLGSLSPVQHFSKVIPMIHSE